MTDLHTAAKQALEALELEEAGTHYPTPLLLKAITALRQALSGSVQERSSVEQPASVPEAHKQEPVAWLIDNDYTTVFRDIAEAHRNKGANVEPLYTSPPASKPWVGLTDEEKSDIWCVVTNRDFVTEDTHVYADAIEAKLKEKNA